MAEKTFLPIENRNIPLIDGMQAQLEEACEQLDTQIKTGSFLKPIDGIWTEARVRNAISEMTGENTNHEVKRSGIMIKTYKGLYMWVSKDRQSVGYVGISQFLQKRIPNHVTAPNKSMATWAHMMSKNPKHLKNLNPLKFTKAAQNSKYDFDGRRELQDFILKNFDCTVYLETNDYLLYILEVYASMRYKSFWNVFQTH